MAVGEDTKPRRRDALAKKQPKSDLYRSAAPVILQELTDHTATGPEARAL